VVTSYSKSSIVGEERTNPIVIIAKEDQFLGAPHNALIYFPDNSSRCHDGAPPESWKRRVSTRAIRGSVRKNPDGEIWGQRYDAPRSAMSA
jgi:hypothetical protein